MKVHTYNRNSYRKMKNGIMTVGQLLDALKDMDKDTMIVWGGDGEAGWYDNIEAIQLADDDAYVCVTLVQGKPYDTRQG